MILPSLLEISELCILGLSWAILRRCPRDQTMNAFMGRLMWSLLWWRWCCCPEEDPAHMLAISNKCYEHSLRCDVLAVKVQYDLRPAVEPRFWPHTWEPERKRVCVEYEAPGMKEAVRLYVRVVLRRRKHAGRLAIVKVEEGEEKQLTWLALCSYWARRSRNKKDGRNSLSRRRPSCFISHSHIFFFADVLSVSDNQPYSFCMGSMSFISGTAFLFTLVY